MNKNPEVSVIIPTYNRGNLIARAIQSVLKQTHQNFEIIVIDDASADNTKEVIQSFNDSRIKYIKHQVNKGGSAARNTGIKIAQGKYIAFLDSDDEWLPEKLEKQVKKIKESNEKVGVIYTRYWILQNNKKFLSKEPQKRGDIFEDELFEDWITPTSCVLVKKECFERVGGFDENLPVRQDYDMWLRISKYFYFDFIKEPLVKIYLDRDTNRITSTDFKKQISAENQILEKIKKEIYSWPLRKQKKLISRHYYILGKRLCVNGNTFLGRKFFLKAVKTYPFSLSYFLFFLISLFGAEFYNTLLKTYRKIRTLSYENSSS